MIITEEQAFITYVKNRDHPTNPVKLWKNRDGVYFMEQEDTRKLWELFLFDGNPVASNLDPKIQWKKYFKK